MKKIKDKNYYMNLPYKMVIQRFEDEFEAHYIEYPKVVGLGNTEEEAIKELKDLFEDMIEVLLRDGLEIKEPEPQIKKQRVNVLISEKVLEAIKKTTNNRSVFLERSAQYILNNKINVLA